MKIIIKILLFVFLILIILILFFIYLNKPQSIDDLKSTIPLINTENTIKEIKNDIEEISTKFCHNPQQKNCIQVDIFEEAVNEEAGEACNFNDKQIQEACINKQETLKAVKTSNPEICENIENETEKLICNNQYYYNQAIKESDQKYCNQISGEEDKNICINALK